MVINYQANKHDRRVSPLRLRRVNAFSFSLQNLLQDTYETVFWWSSQCLLNHDKYFGQIYGTPWCTNGMHQLPKFGSFFHLPDPISLVMQSVSNPYKSAGRCRETVVENCVAKIGNKVSLTDIWVWKMTIFYSIKYEAIVMSRMRGINVLRLLRGYKSSAFNRPSVWSVLAV